MSEPLVSLRCLSWKLGIPLEFLRELAGDAVRHYHPFAKQRPGRKPRWIDNPDKTLRKVQKAIYNVLLKPLSIPDFLHGSVKGRSPRTNVQTHLRRRWVVRLDLEDFFPSITDMQVYAIWSGLLKYSPRVSSLLTSLTTYHCHLPQGAPTSSSLSNLVLLDADMEIATEATQAGCFFTRYVDDLGLSGDCPQELNQFTINTLRRAGFRVSRKKLRLMHASAPQEITGLMVNSISGPSISRDRRDAIRASIHQIGTLKGARLEARWRSIRGKIAHVSLTNPGSGKRLQRSLDAALLKHPTGCYS